MSKEQLWDEFEHAKPRVSVPREAWEAGWRAKGDYLRGVREQSYATCVSTDDLMQAMIDKIENQKNELAKLNQQIAAFKMGKPATEADVTVTHEPTPVEIPSHIQLCDEPLCCQLKGHSGDHDDLPF